VAGGLTRSPTDTALGVKPFADDARERARHAAASFEVDTVGA